MRRDRCSQVTRDIFDYVMTAAKHAEQGVERPTFEARGVGITF